MNLNSEQQTIVESTERQILVAAGPGSGKSTTLVARIAARVTAGVDAQRIYLVTYTTAGAKVFTEKLQPLGIKLGYAGTLHGLLLRLLNKHGALIGYRRGRNLTIIDEPSRLQLLRETAEKLGYGKLSMRAIEEGDGPKAQQVLKEYAFEVKRANMIDYAGILVEGLKLLVLHRDVLGIDLAELCIDEAQDASAIDWMIYDRIPAETLTVIGDDAQSIFAFRGAKPELFIERAKTATLFSLETNYRSAVSICTAANNLIAHNMNRIQKVIRPATETEGSVQTLVIGSSREEPAMIGSFLRYENSAKDVPWSEMAVLARTNLIADDIRSAFRDMGIPTANERPALPAHWSFCLLVFQLLLDPANNLLCERFLKERCIAAAVVNRMKMDAMKEGWSLHALAVDSGLTVPMLRDDQPLLSALAKIGVDQECLDIVAEREQALPEDGSNSDLLADLFASETWQAAPSEGAFIGTIHSGKGREWDVVIVAGLEEGVLPSLSKSSDESEERRLAFVAMTRARYTLILSWCRRRTAYGRTTDQQMSRFITEALP